MKDLIEKDIPELIIEKKHHVKEMKRLLSSDFTKEFFEGYIKEYLPEVESFIEKTTGNTNNNIKITHNSDWLDKLLCKGTIPPLDYHSTLSLKFTSDTVSISFIIKGSVKKKFIDTLNSHLLKYEELRKEISHRYREIEKVNSIAAELTTP